jgi:hypothetical protein
MLAFESLGFDIEQKLQSDERRKTVEGGNFRAMLAKMQAGVLAVSDAPLRQRAAALGERIRGLNIPSKSTLRSPLSPAAPHSPPRRRPCSGS